MTDQQYIDGILQELEEREMILEASYSYGQMLADGMLEGPEAND